MGVRLIVGLQCSKKGGKHGGGKSREKLQNGFDEFSLVQERRASKKRKDARACLVMFLQEELSRVQRSSQTALRVPSYDQKT